MVEFTGRLTPEHGAPLKTAIEALVSDEMRATRDAARDGTADPDAPRRSVVQMQADALVRLCEHALGCPEKDLPLHGATVVVRIDHDDLVERHRVRDDRRDHRPGLGRHRPADGRRRRNHLLRPRRRQRDPGLGPHPAAVLPEPAPRAPRTRRRLRDVRGTTRTHQGPPHPMVGAGCRTHRPRTTASCSASPVTTASTTTGGTSASTASASHAKVWFIPPPHVDPARTPRLGGRARYDYAA